nr:unnamed protein product [Digitaria exilis]
MVEWSLYARMGLDNREQGARGAPPQQQQQQASPALGACATALPYPTLPYPSKQPDSQLLPPPRRRIAPYVLRDAAVEWNTLTRFSQLARAGTTPRRALLAPPEPAPKPTYRLPLPPGGVVRARPEPAPHPGKGDASQAGAMRLGGAARSPLPCALASPPCSSSPFPFLSPSSSSHHLHLFPPSPPAAAAIAIGLRALRPGVPNTPVPFTRAGISLPPPPHKGEVGGFRGSQIRIRLPHPSPNPRRRPLSPILKESVLEVRRFAWMMVL